MPGNARSGRNHVPRKHDNFTHKCQSCCLLCGRAQGSMPGPVIADTRCPHFIFLGNGQFRCLRCQGIYGGTEFRLWQERHYCVPQGTESRADGEVGRRYQDGLWVQVNALLAHCIAISLPCFCSQVSWVSSLNPLDSPLSFHFLKFTRT